MPVPVRVVQTGLEKSIADGAKAAGRNLRINMGPGAKSIESLSKPLGRLTGKADEFTKSMEAANARVLAFGASVGVISAVTNGFQNLIKTTIQVEKSLASINSILGANDAQLNKFKKNIFDIARETEQSFATVSEAALELSRQGLKAEEVTKRLKDSLILARLSGLSAADAVGGLTAAINSFSSQGLTSAEVLNKISAAAASAAVSDRDLIEGLKRSGAVAVASGVQFDELVGIIGALQERTARGGAVIGNSLKTIFTRIQDLDKLKALQDLGVDVTDLSGKVLSSNKIIENLAPTFAKLDQASKVNLADNLVGKFQIAPFLALLEDYNLKVSRSGEIATTSFGAANEAYLRNEALNKTLSAAINEATVNLSQLGETLGKIGITDSLKNLLGFFNSLTTDIQNLLDGEGIGSKLAQGIVKGLGAIVTGPGIALVGAVILKLLADFGKFGLGALKTFFGLNKAAERQAALQGQITATLLNDKQVRQDILNIENQSISAEETRRKQAEYFETALREQLSLMQQMQGIAGDITPKVLKSTAPLRGKGGKNAAGGFLPIGAERNDIARGVGGAPSSAKPVVIPNFAFGGGQRGTMVANTSEYIVPNYANGGDAIFNQQMVSSMGLPANAKKVRAASGYIPNFAQKPVAEQQFSAFLQRRFPNAFNANNRYSNTVVAKELGVLNSEATQKALYSNSALRKEFDALSQTDKRNLLKGREQTRATQEEFKTRKKTRFAVLYPDAVGGTASSTIEVAGMPLKTVPIDTEPPNALYSHVRDSLVDASLDYAATLGFKPDIVKDEKFRAAVDRNLNPGTVEGALGTVFEAAFQGAIGTDQKSNERWDLNSKAAIDSLIGQMNAKGILAKRLEKDLEGIESADFKNSLSADNILSMQGKMSGNKKSKKKSKNAAEGYIPNFSALEDAIGRERSAGLPISQIRINQSGKLRNAQNPMGLAVTNTRDEPTGAIPNYADGGTGEVSLTLKDVGSSAKGLKSELDNLNKLINSLNSEIAAGTTTHAQASQQIDEFSEKVSNNKKSQEKVQKAAKDQLKVTEEKTKADKNYMGIMFGVSAGLSALSAATSDSESAVARYTSVITDSLSTATSYAFAGQAVSEFGGNLKESTNSVVSGLGGFVSSIGTIGAGVGVAMEAFDLAKNLMNEYSGETERAKDSLARLTDVSRDLTYSFEDLNEKQKRDVEKQAGDLMKRVTYVSDLQETDSGFVDTLTAVKEDRSFSSDEVKQQFEETLKNMLTEGMKPEDIRAFLDKNLNREIVATDIDWLNKDLSEFSEKVKPASEAFDKLLKSLSDQEIVNLSLLKSDPTSVPNDEQSLSNLMKVQSQLAGEEFGVLTKANKDKQFQRELERRETNQERDAEKVSTIQLDQLKRRLQAQGQLFQIKQDILSASQQELAQMESQGSTDKKRELELKKIIANEQLSINNSRELLDAAFTQIGAIEGLNAEKIKGAEIEKKLAGFMEDGVFSAQDAKAFVDQFVASLTEGGQVAESQVSSFGEIVDNITKAQEAQKEVNNNNLDIEQSFENQAYLTDLIYKNLSEASRLNFEGIKLERQTADNDLAKEIANLENQKKGSSKARILQIDKEIADLQKTRQGGDVSSIMAIRDQKLTNLADAFEKQRKAAGTDKDKIAQLEAVYLRDYQNLIKATDLEISAAEQRADADVKAAEAAGRITKASVIYADLIFDLAQSTQSALGQSMFNEKQLGLMGLTREASKEARKQEAIKAGAARGLSPENALREYELSKTFNQRMNDLRKDDKVINSEFLDKMVDASVQFRDNFTRAFAEGIDSVDDLKSALLNAANQFLKSMTQNFVSKWMDQSAGNGGMFGLGLGMFSDGGRVRGGSGNRDDVPAMLMGGEYVINKKAVNKYGMRFMEALNSGSIGGYASGGQVRDKEGMFTTPGMNGAGAIRGGANLMAFATQSPNALSRDTITGSGAYLDPESARLTMFGRRNNPQFQKVQDAKRQAFDLAVQERQAYEEAESQKVSLGNMLASAFISTAVGLGTTALGSSFGLSDATSKLIGSGVGNLAGTLATGAPASGGAFGAAATEAGAFSLFSSDKASKAIWVDSYGNPIQRRATGGLIPSQSGVDTVPAMLSGGEFVMNAAATRNIGAGNLQAMNSGAGMGDNSELVSKLDELIRTTESSQSTGQINITINGSTGAEDRSGGQDASDQQKALSEKIKTAVKQVIADEKRLGGQLRR